MSDVHDGPKEQVAIGRLKELYVDGDLSLSELEAATEDVYGGEPDAFDVKETCLVCGGSSTGPTRYPTLGDVRCPGCGRPRDADDVPRAVL